MSRVIAIFLVLIMFVLTGCPVITIKSIDDGTFVIPSYLPGKWTQFDKDGKKIDNYVIRPNNKNKKGIVNCNKIYRKDEDTASDFKIIMSELDGKVYINIYSPLPDSSDSGNESNAPTPYGYYIYEFRRITDKEFTLSGIRSDAIKSDATRQEIADFLKKNKDNQDIIDPNEFSRFKRL